MHDAVCTVLADVTVEKNTPMLAQGAMAAARTKLTAATHSDSNVPAYLLIAAVRAQGQGLETLAVQLFELVIACAADDATLQAAEGALRAQKVTNPHEHSKLETLKSAAKGVNLRQGRRPHG